MRWKGRAWFSQEREGNSFYCGRLEKKNSVSVQASLVSSPLTRLNIGRSFRFKMVTSFLLRIHDQRECNCTGGWRYDQRHWDNTATQGGFRQNAEVEDGDIVMATQQRLECRHRSANLLSMAVKKGRERHEMWNYVAWSHEEERVQEFLRDYKHLHKRGDECVACQVHQSWRHKIYGRPVRVVPLQVMPGLEMEWHFLATAESDGPSRLYLVQSPCPFFAWHCTGLFPRWPTES